MQYLQARMADLMKRRSAAIEKLVYESFPDGLPVAGSYVTAVWKSDSGLIAIMPADVGDCTEEEAVRLYPHIYFKMDLS